MTQKVFIVHGHDKKALAVLIDMLLEWKVEPVVLSQLPDSGLTIIEKFERYARRCDFAIVLLTPDDKNAEDLPARDKYRARQNVIFEMGWFFSYLGRDGTILLYKGDVEIPGDVTGILYKKFLESPREKQDEIRQALLLGGVRVPDTLVKGNTPLTIAADRKSRVRKPKGSTLMRPQLRDS